MKYKTTAYRAPASIKTDCLILPVFESDTLPAVTAELDQQLDGLISRRLSDGDITGKSGQVRTLYELPDIAARKVMLVGCGDADEFSVDKLASVMTKVSGRLKSAACKTATSFLLSELDEQNEAAAQSVMLMEDSRYHFDDYKSDAKKDKSKLKELVLVGDEIEDSVRQAACIAQGKKLTRDLANHPGNVCTPDFLAKTARQLDKTYDSIKTDVLGEADMEALGMGSFLSVSKGSKLEGKMISMQYSGGKKNAAPVVLVGKGITFDTGGISLKPGAKMDEMKFDMGGAASVFGVMKAIAEMKLPINVVGVVAAAENMPSGKASKPGDIVTSMSGKTIEVLNTDAEGRLVLCDALTWVEKFKPDVVIDIATLTGACIVALGHHICGLISNDDELAEDLMAAGLQSRDEAWRLPYNDKYSKQLKSEFADLGNIGGPAAGTITAGCFLAAFAEDYRWAHLDIAGTAWKGKAATGRPVPLLTRYLIDRSQS